MLPQNLCHFRMNLLLRVQLQLRFCRDISSELTTALRPFYFAVHPDLFGKHPKQRSINEDSLKQLSAHMETLSERKFHLLHEPRTLQFYIRDTNAMTRDTFKLISLRLDQSLRDPKNIVQKLLELCNLPTDYIKSVKILTPTNQKSNGDQTGAHYGGFQPGQDYSYGKEFAGFTYSYYQAKEAQRKSLDTWIMENATIARTRSGELADLKEEVEKLRKSLIARLGLQDARYDCGWNYEHFRGCLKTLERLANLHEKHMLVLKNRIVVFAPFTGVSLEGHVMLYTGDVLNNWIDFIKNIPNHDAFLKKIPLYENTLSLVLRNIKIGRRKFMPKQQAKEYASHLTKITTTLGDIRANKFPESWPASLEEYEIVIESEAGPLMVNPTGQMIAPATCPGFMLIDFITNNLAVAKERIAKYKQTKDIEKELIQRCVRDMQLESLTKDDSVTPDKMIEALNGLLKYDPLLFKNLNLHIANYYSVLSDGTVCIPWDFMNR